MVIFVPVKGRGGNNFMKQSEIDKSIVGFFLGEVVHSGYVHYVKDEGMILCTGKADCVLCKTPSVAAARFQFKAPFALVNDEGGVTDTVIFQGGKVIYDALVSLNEEMDVTAFCVKIKRTITGGRAMDVSYAVIPTTIKAPREAIQDIPTVLPYKTAALLQGTQNLAEEEILSLED